MDTAAQQGGGHLQRSAADIVLDVNCHEHGKLPGWESVGKEGFVRCWKRDKLVGADGALNRGDGYGYDEEGCWMRSVLLKLKKEERRGEGQHTAVHTCGFDVGVVDGDVVWACLRRHKSRHQDERKQLDDSLDSDSIHA